MVKRHRLYWTCQIVGWGTYVFLIAIFNKISGIVFDSIIYFNLAFTFILGVGTSHLYRNYIVKNDWLKLRIAQLIPRVLLASLILSIVFYAFHTLISDFIISGRKLSFEFIDVLKNLINLSANYLLWTLIYWSFHFIENYKKEEIKNLRWQATINEMELNKIKSQLNPHFIFNSMNSIRALVDEKPAKAQLLITQLSNILRSTLYMERKPVISFSDEMSLVKDYLELEKARLENRLDYLLNIDEESYNYNVPPLLFQTLVENGIKHGINHLESGGIVSLDASVSDNALQVVIKNTGNLKKEVNGKEGIGLKISRQRLKLLYGDRASLDLSEENDLVKAKIVIPKELEKEQNYESTVG